MIYDVLAQPVQGIDFAPASKAAEILQNLRRPREYTHDYSETSVDGRALYGLK